MKTKTTIISGVTSLFAILLTGMTAHAQFNETMGTTGPATQDIAPREAAGLFSVTALTYSGTADVRNNTASTGYAPTPSGGYNVLIQAQETFEVRSIDASHCNASDSISFGIFKNTNAATGVDFLVVEYSIDNGATYFPFTYTALPTGTGTSHWYRRSVVLPTAALVNNLRFRFRSTLTGGSTANPQYRIDDVKMSCGNTVDCSGLTATADIAGGSAVFCAGTASTDIEVIQNFPSHTIQWYNQDGIVTGETSDLITVENSGTYYAVVTSTATASAGCQATTAGIYILAYPTPEVCETTIEGCEGATQTYCPTLRTNDMIISEYVEGSGFNKYLELYNGTCETLDMGDYEVRLYVNGATTPTVISLIAGTLIAPGATYVLAHDQATHIPAVNQYNSLANWNGNDAIALYNLSATHTADIVGSIGNNPGSSWRDTVTGSPTKGWTTEDKTLVRKACIYSGIDVNPALPGIYGFPTLLTEWDTLPKDNTAGLGMHTFGGTPFTFAIAGTSTLSNATATCVDVTIGAGTSTLSVTPTLCTFNNCGPIEVSVAGRTCEGRVLTTGAAQTLNASVFPNPFSDNTTIEFTQKQEGTVAVTITDLAGHVVLAKTVQATAGTQRVELSLSQLATGSYVCTIVSAQGQETVRIVKSK